LSGISIFLIAPLLLFCIQSEADMADKEKINRIKLVLVEKGITQKDFAKSLSMSPSSMFRFCKNESQPSLRTLKRMADKLEIDIRELLISTRGKK
jgi:transcriptional regulator with XRE-family HTH domain